MSVFASVCIWLPQTGEWSNLISTLRDLDSWVPTTAIPTLVTGSYRNLPTINAGIDVIDGDDDMRIADFVRTVDARPPNGLRTPSFSLRECRPAALRDPFGGWRARCRCP